MQLPGKSILEKDGYSNYSTNIIIIFNMSDLYSLIQDQREFEIITF